MNDDATMASYYLEQDDVQGLVLSGDSAITPEIVDSDPSQRAIANKPIDALQQADEFYGAGNLQLTDAQAGKLTAPIDLDDIDILPTGEIYYAHDQYRRRLNESVGVGQWSLRPLEPWQAKGNTVVREFALIINGKFAATGLGEADYHPSNPRSSWATACESAKSIALRRACKEIGIALECWNKRFATAWTKKHAVKVWRSKQGRDKTGEYQWRRIDAEPFYDEANSNSPAGAGHSTSESSANSTSYNQTAVKSDSSVTQTAQSESPAGEDSAVTIRPKEIGKVWKLGGFVFDATGTKWTFPNKFLQLAENAILSNKSVVITWKKNRDYLNVLTAEIV